MKELWRSCAQLLRESLIWSNTISVNPSRIIISMLALTGPVAFGIFLNNISLGTNMAIAGYVIGTDIAPDKWADKLRVLVVDTLLLTFAMATGLNLSLAGISSKVVFILITAIAATLGSLSLWATRIAMLFIIVMIIGRSLGQHGVDTFKATELFLLGSLWIIAINLFLTPILDLFFQKLYGVKVEVNIPTDTGWKHLWRHWKNSLKHFSGWLYVLRLVSCLIVAEIFLYFFPNSHSYWTFITIVVVVHRNPHEALKKKIQRILGTLTGVTVASLLLIWNPSVFVKLGILLVLTGLRPVIKVKNYAAYCLLMTLFVMVLTDLSHQPTISILWDRFFAAVMGSVIAFIVGYGLWHKKLKTVT